MYLERKDYNNLLDYLRQIWRKSTWGFNNIYFWIPLFKIIVTEDARKSCHTGPEWNSLKASSLPWAAFLGEHVTGPVLHLLVLPDQCSSSLRSRHWQSYLDTAIEK